MDDELSPVEQLRKELEEVGDDKGKETPTEAPANKEKNVSKSSTAKKAAKKPAKKKPVRVAKKEQPAEKAAASKKTTKAPAKKKSAPKKAAPAKKPVKAAKKAPAKKAPAKKTPADAGTKRTKRTKVRDRQGDGLTPIERKIVAFIADQEEPVSVVTIGRRMFGKDCPSEGENSFRTVRNGLRFPIKYGMVDQVKVKGETKRGLYKIGAAYKRSKGNLEKLNERYRARVAKEREAS